MLCVALLGLCCLFGVFVLVDLFALFVLCVVFGAFCLHVLPVLLVW